MPLNADDVWELFQRGVCFKSGIGLYETARKNERFFAGDQWAGVTAPDLPKPVINFIKRACQQKIAEVNANPVRVCFSARESGQKEELRLGDGDASMLGAVFEADCERMKMDTLLLDGLQDACISGDCILYLYWDAQAETGQPAKGQISAELIDNVNYYPGDPRDTEVQRQPYIILARRESVEAVRAQARANGRPADEIEQISEDAGMPYATLPGGECITLLYLCRDAESGRIMAHKSTRQAVVRPKWATGLTRYPVALMNWERSKSSCHGRAEVTGLIPVQRYVNQMYAMSMLYTMQSAFPKPVYHQGMVKAWSNTIGAAIPVNGDINSAVRYLAPPDLPKEVLGLPETLMKTTLQLVGVSDIMMGSVSPTNMSALELARQASTVPIGTIQGRLYAMLEDFARNWLDMLTACCRLPRYVAVAGKSRDGAEQRLLDASRFRGRLWSVRIEAGPGSMWSEISSMQTLASLYQSGAITAEQYVERLPEGRLPGQQRLLAEMAGKRTSPAKPLT